MRNREKQNKVSVHAIAGTYVVMLGIDMEQGDTAGLLGFAIHRTDPQEKEAYWLPGMRTFEASYPNPPDGALVSSYEHPIQDFLWSDFTAKPGYTYTYKIVPVRGKPKNLQYDEGVEIVVQTEQERASGELHKVYFNRGVIGSQAYARKWKAAPDQLPPAEKAKALEWLSRGLEEAALAFIAQAQNKTFGLRAAVYEFSYKPVGEALGKALRDCGDVRIVYDARISGEKGAPSKKEAARVAATESLLKMSGLTNVAVGRTQNPSSIAHNKFIVLLENDKPVAVWTGSTNFTESGVFGQSNVGHVVRDPAIANQFLTYWDRLCKDPDSAQLRVENEAATPTLTAYPPSQGVTPLFSPRRGGAQLDWYSEAMDHATSMMCFTGAFGVNPVFLKVFAQDKDYLRYVFLEKWGTTKETAAATDAALSKDHDVQVAVGTTLEGNVVAHWMKEVANTISSMVRYTHTKFMLIDPLGDDPVVISGSANFSTASTSSNDENMLVIRGDKRVADIYLGEFMRLWRHHNFRYMVTTADAINGNGSTIHNYLYPNDHWAAPFYDDAKVKMKRRLAFA